jgi:hypothetical protein
VVWRTFSSFRNSSAVSRNGSQSIPTLVLSGAGLIFSLRLLIEFQSMGGEDDLLDGCEDLFRVFLTDVAADIHGHMATERKRKRKKRSLEGGPT